MEIIDNTGTTVLFGDLQCGQVFNFAGNYYLVTELDDELFGVNLKDGSTHTFDLSCAVTTVHKATLTIE